MARTAQLLFVVAVNFLLPYALGAATNVSLRLVTVYFLFFILTLVKQSLVKQSLVKQSLVIYILTLTLTPILTLALILTLTLTPTLTLTLILRPAAPMVRQNPFDSVT